MNKLIVALSLTAIAGLTVASASAPAYAAAAEATPAEKARTYTEGTLVAMLGKLTSLQNELKDANRDRAGWTGYTEDWKKWTPEEAEKNKNSFTYGEYLWSARKDKTFRQKHMESAAAKELKKLQEDSGGVIAELFITDAKGGNVCQTAATSDWFQGDEEKFTKVDGKKECFYPAPKRDDTVGATGVQVSVPIWGQVDGKEQFIGVAVALVIVDKIK